MSNQQMNQNQMRDSGVEWIGAIPKEWQTVKLFHLLKNNDGGVWGEFSEDGYIVLRSTEIDLNGRWRIDNPAVVNLLEDEFNRYKLYEGDILIVKSSGSDSHIGKAALVTKEVEEKNCAYSNFTQRLRFKKYISPKYMYYVLNSMVVKKQINYLSTTSTGLSNLNQDMINRLKSPVPPFCEQQAIANYLDEQVGKLDDLISEQKKAIEKWKEYKQSLITEIVTKGLNPEVEMKDSGIEWIGDIPKAWGVYPIKHVAGLNPAYADLLEDANSVSFAPMETLRTGRLKPYKALLSDVKGKYTPFKENDILMAKVTPCFENGNIAIATGLINGVGFGSSEFYVFRAKRCETSFLYYFLQNDVFKQEAVSTMYGTGGLKRVNSSFVKNYKIPLPPLHEQQAIADYLDEKCLKIDQTIEQKELLIKQLEEYKQSLIYECVTGKRRVF